MPLVVKDRVKEITATTGTGTLTLGGAPSGFQSFSVIGNGNTTYYAIVDQAAGAWEVGVGTYTASGTTLSRDSVLESSNSGSLVNFGAGSKDVFCTYPAERSLYVDGSSIVPATSATLPITSGGTGLTTLTANNVILGNGASTPTFVAPGTSGNVLTSNGTTWTSAAPAGGASAITIDNKTGAYTVVSGDLGKIINCTANSFTVSLTAAATLGAGFNCWIWNTSSTASHVITIDPSGSETIDGRTTLSLRRGEGMQIVCDGTNWQTGDKKVMRGYAENLASTNARPIASGDRAISIAYDSQATATDSLALGSGARATALATTAIGLNSGQNGSQAVTGSGAMALGGSYASGTDSFAAAIGNNTSSYGAKGANSIVMGLNAVTGGAHGIVIGENAVGVNNQAYQIIIGRNSGASGQGCLAFGNDCSSGGGSSTSYTLATGYFSRAEVTGKYAYASGAFSGVWGSAQTGTFVLRRETTDATATVLTTNNAAASATNQVILPNDSTYAFRILVVARRTDADNESAGYEFSGVIDRNANAASTAIVGTVAKTVLAEDTTAWDVAVTADTTNGGLKVEVTGEAAKTIRWVATVWTSEVTG